VAGNGGENAAWNKQTTPSSSCGEKLGGGRSGTADAGIKKRGAAQNKSVRSARGAQLCHPLAKLRIIDLSTNNQPSDF
jgi:hypothetical protein